MRRSVCPRLEQLEGKALLSGISATTAGLADSMSAVVSRTISGSQVVMTLTETNVSNHDITIDHGPSNQGFTATQGGKVVWSSTVGLVPFVLTVETLKPHQSLTLSATWDGRANNLNPTQPWEEGPPLSGTYTISNALDQHQATITVTLPKLGSTPVKLTHLVPPRPSALVPAVPIVDPLR